MLTRSSVLIIGMIATLLLAFSFSGADELAKRSRIEISGGIWGQGSKTSVEVGISGVTTTTGASGATGGIMFSHWIQEDYAATISVGMLAMDVSTDVSWAGVSTNTVIVSPILFGVRYYLPRSSYSSSWRPYLSVSTGPYIGSQSKIQTGSTVVVESGTHYAFGGRIGGGLDIQLSRSFMLGLGVGYHLVTDFSEPLGGRQNYSGPGFSIGIGLLFGGRK